jgi:hypothetical protein
MDAVWLKPEGHDEMSPLRYDQLFMLTILRMGGVLSEEAWSDQIYATGIRFTYNDWFIGTVEWLAEQQYIRQHGWVDPESDYSLSELSKRVHWTLTERGSMLFGEDPLGPEEADPATATAAGLVTITFKLKQAQAEVVQNALAKAKGELHTEFDTVALERLCAGYVGGVSAVAKIPMMDELIDEYGLEPLLTRVAEKFPDLDISVTEPGKR